MPKTLVLTLLACIPIALAGCAAAVVDTGTSAVKLYILSTPTNFTAQHYAVADYLYQQAESFVEPEHLIKAEPLTDLDAPEVQTLMASAIPETIGIRLSQLGFSVDLSDVSTSADTQYLRPKMEGQNADFVLTGNYIDDGGDFDVKVRMIDLHEKRVIATFDYTIEIRGDLKRLSKPKTIISRVPN